MRRQNFSRFVHVIVIACLMVASLSPLCHVRGGQGMFIQICKADGSVESVAATPSYIPDEFRPFLLGHNDSVPVPETPKVQEQCAFCFFDADLGFVSDFDFDVFKHKQSGVYDDFSSDQIRAYRRYIMPPSRAPPSFIV